MKKKYKVAPEVRQELLNRIRNEGLSVAQAAKDAGVSETTVYGWLGKGADSVPSVLEFAKLKRENKELLELVGELTLKLSTAQKRNDRQSSGNSSPACESRRVVSSIAVLSIEAAGQRLGAETGNRGGTSRASRLRP